MTYVLDTNIVSALMRGEEACAARFARESPNDVFVPHPVIAEIRYGLARLPRSRRKVALSGRAATLFAAISRAPWTEAVSDRFAATKVDLERRGVRLEDMDVIIAAHALAMSATLVTRNVGQFSRVKELELETWE